VVPPNRFRAAIMTETYIRRTRYALWVLSVVASGLAVLGGTLAYSAQSSAAAQEGLYGVIAELTTNQMQLISERDELAGYLTAARQALAVLGDRLATVAGARDAAQVQSSAPRDVAAMCERPSLEAQVKQTGTLRKTRHEGSITRTER
jgi:hypothetical protein